MPDNRGTPQQLLPNSTFNQNSTLKCKVICQGTNQNVMQVLSIHILSFPGNISLISNPRSNRTEEIHISGLSSVQVSGILSQNASLQGTYSIS